jgi:RNA polymerase sigma-70 factor (ECF subfamily)
MIASLSVDGAERERFENEIRAHCERGDLSAAATAAIHGYGRELFGFLVAIHSSRADASDSYSELCEILWRKLPDFAWDGTLRAWLYGIARNVTRTRRRNANRRLRRERPGKESVFEQAVQAVRTETLAFLRTQKRNRLQSLRDELPEEDRMLLILRVDRRLEWPELARALAGDDVVLDDASLKREAARLRKRYQIVKDRLRERAKEEGLVE